MSIDEQHVALPKLYGAPAYARPASSVATSPRPFDPDDMPIEAFQSEEDREFAASLPARAWAPGGAIVDRPNGDGIGQSGNGHSGNGHGRSATHGSGFIPRQLRLRSIAGRLLGGD